MLLHKVELEGVNTYLSPIKKFLLNYRTQKYLHPLLISNRGGFKLNISTILLLVSYIIEPFIWLATFDRCLQRKYTNKFIYLFYLLGDWLIATVREPVTVAFPEANVIFTIILIIYVMIFVNLTYEGVISKRLLLIGILFITSLCSDFIVIGILVLLGNSVVAISTAGLLNSLASLLSKFIFYILTFIVYRKKYKLSEATDEIIPIIFGTILCELPSVILYNQITLLGNNAYLLIFFVFSQIVLLGLVTYVIITLSKRKKMELQLRTRLHDIEIEMSSNQSWEENMKEVRHFRHDIKIHLSVLKGLLQESKYDNAEKYLNEISEEVNQTEEFCTLKNRNVAIALGQKKRLADKLGVKFLPEIMVEDFIISDKDICSILCNVLDNAIEAASICENGFLNIVVKPDHETAGYFITCENSYQEVILRRGKYVTTKGDQDNHGLGIDIIKRLVKDYHGKCSFNNNKETKHFFVDIYIPGE